MTLMKNKRPLWAIALTLVTLGIILRCWDLADRPLHHDEAIHATFSFYWFENARTGFYHYDPIYHGPFLYWCVQWLYHAFGVGVVQARLFPLVFGIAVVLSPITLLPWLGPVSTTIAMVSIAVSPLFSYYARFLAHDMPTCLFTVLAVAAFLRFRVAADENNRTRATTFLALAAASLGVLFSIKASSFLHTFIFASFGIFYWLVKVRKATFSTIWKARGPERLGQFALAASVFLFCYGLFETAIFRFPTAFADGLYRKVFPYWWGQHSVERLGGPATYHLRSLLLHELPATLLVFALLGRALGKSKPGKIALGVLAVTFLICVLSPWELAAIFPGFLASFFKVFKVRASGEIFVYVTCSIFGIGLAAEFLRRGRVFVAFLTYWGFSSLAIYSFAGEKTPWLTVHVAFPMILLVARLIPELYTARALPKKRKLEYGRSAMALFGVLAIFYQLRLTYLVNFPRAGSPGDLLSQIHNSRDILTVMDWIKKVARETGRPPREFRVGLMGEPTWGFYFYLIESGMRNYVGEPKGLDGNERFILSDESSIHDTAPRLSEQHYETNRFVSRGWWVPEHHRLTWGDWFHYAWTREPKPEQVARSPLLVFFKPETEPSPRNVSGQK